MWKIEPLKISQVLVFKDLFQPTVRFIWLRICMWPVIFVIPCVEFSPCAKLWQSMTSAHGWILRYPWSRKDCTGSVGRKLQFKPFTSYTMIINDYRMVINGFVMVCYYSMFMVFFFLMGFSLTYNLGISGHNWLVGDWWAIWTHLDAVTRGADVQILAARMEESDAQATEERGRPWGKRKAGWCIMYYVCTYICHIFYTHTCIYIYMQR